MVRFYQAKKIEPGCGTALHPDSVYLVPLLPEERHPEWVEIVISCEKASRECVSVCVGVGVSRACGFLQL